ncbi:peptidase domain-containing ABC transporter [Facilibium subflavum]|uniref:peptidase domain-containing ABC transporter n=1 Tax=Facilibium subflavum TaxID=2219058 RepID=UPI000E65CE4B|nr:peptidase domain-containing ABC transporter [Facilibium subflavum]
MPGICKTPINIQYEVADCGVACLAIILEYYHAYPDYNTLKKTCDPGTRGLSYEELIQTASEYGLVGKKQIYTVETIKNTHTPIIILMDNQHYMVYEGIKGKKVYLNDPVQGRIIYHIKDFQQHFSCVGLPLTPGDTFQKTPKPHIVWQAFKSYGESSFSSYFYIGAFFLLSTIPAIISANYSNIFIDYYLLEHQKNIMVPFLCFILVFITLQVTIEACQHFMMKKLQIIINAGVNSRYLIHLFSLPYLFFSKRPTGDLINIIQSNTELAFQLSGRLFLNILAFFQSLIFLLVMFGYSVPLTIVVLVAIILSFLISYFLKDTLLVLHTKLRNQQGIYYAVSMYFIQLLETIKASGKDPFFFMMWLNAFTDVQNTKQRLGLYKTIVSHVSLFFVSITAVVITCLGCYLIIKGQLSVGQLMAFMILAGLLHKPTQAIANYYSLLIATSVNIKRKQAVTSQIMRQDQSKTNFLSQKAYETAKENFQGSISIKDLHFRYNQKSNEILTGINLNIASHEKIAIIGNSGCGKSTLLNLISGILPPTQGQIDINEINLMQYAPGQREKLILKVAKQTRLINGSIRENMCFGSYYSNEAIFQALAAVGIADDIKYLKAGINHYLSSSQSTLSLGQIKLIDIATAVMRKPDILLLDEPLDALDSTLEHKLMESLCQLQHTVIIITHRMHYLDLFDKVVWIRSGQISAFAPHQKLMEENTDYRTFIKAGAV